VLFLFMCVCVGGVVLCRCVCVCDLLIFVAPPSSVVTCLWGGCSFGGLGCCSCSCVCVSGVLFSVGVCVTC